VIQVPMDDTAKLPIDVKFLREKLVEYADRTTKVGSFSAASNVSGIMVLEDMINEITALLHDHNALSFWDYAASAPYVNVNMNPKPNGICGDAKDEANTARYAKDAVFISPHKFVGGVGTPGVLVIKRRLLEKSAAPNTPGGGTVFYVTEMDHIYVKNMEEREEGGTPDIVGSIRCGLAFQLKQNVGSKLIHERETTLVRRALDKWSKHPAISIVGDSTVPRLPIVSFMIRAPRALAVSPETGLTGGYLHFNFVASLLNDLFGIQCRGGCMCAGPYSSFELGLDMESNRIIMDVLSTQNSSVIRPGFVRVNFNFFLPDEEANFMIDAVEFVATHGWKLMPLYAFDPVSGHCMHRVKAYSPKPIRRMADISYAGGHMSHKSARQVCPEDMVPEEVHNEYLEVANSIIPEAVSSVRQADSKLVNDINDDGKFNDKVMSVMWAPMPIDAVHVLTVLAEKDAMAPYEEFDTEEAAAKTARVDLADIKPCTLKPRNHAAA
jgi:selenocysteine lyase/cysteine desulfurase